jgi:hypothetical protein
VFPWPQLLDELHRHLVVTGSGAQDAPVKPPFDADRPSATPDSESGGKVIRVHCSARNNVHVGVERAVEGVSRSFGDVGLQRPEPPWCPCVALVCSPNGRPLVNRSASELTVSLHARRSTNRLHQDCGRAFF